MFTIYIYIIFLTNIDICRIFDVCVCANQFEAMNVWVNIFLGDKVVESDKWRFKWTTMYMER